MRIPSDTVIEYDLTGDGNPQLFDPVYLTTNAVNSARFTNGFQLGMCFSRFRWCDY